MFEQFKTRQFRTRGAMINYRIAGDGPPLVLLHGYPQTHVMWHKIASKLARSFTIVCPDLRGYGDSSKPKTNAEHAPYSKRSMAEDIVELMAGLQLTPFNIAGHDRGGRVTHRLCLDHPNAVMKAAVLDIVPTLTMFETVNQQTATGYYHWYFLIQKEPLPERLIGADPDFYLKSKLGHWSADASGEVFTDAAMAEYQRCFHDPATIHATCEDYRAAATIDLQHDRVTLDRTIECPLMVLWGAKGLVGRAFDVLDIWGRFADDVRGRALECGHFLPEEAPVETLDLMMPFFSH